MNVDDAIEIVSAMSVEEFKVVCERIGLPVSENNGRTWRGVYSVTFMPPQPRILITEHGDNAYGVRCEACGWATEMGHKYLTAYGTARSHNRGSHHSRCVIRQTASIDLTTT